MVSTQCYPPPRPRAPTAYPVTLRTPVRNGRRVTTRSNHEHAVSSPLLLILLNDDMARRQWSEGQKTKARCASLERLLAEAYDLLNMAELQHVRQSSLLAVVSWLGAS